MLSLFYVPTSNIHTPLITLDEDSSRHITQVLRMKVGAALLLTDGQGTRAKAIIEDDHRKRCTVRVLEKNTEPAPEPRITVAISLVKNAARFEWFLEKATEVGISEIIPLICERTEKEKFRHDRMQNIIVSALLQSQQCWMPLLHEPVAFEQLVRQKRETAKYIAHCLPQQKEQLASVVRPQPAIILIGPEGDFTPQEIEWALGSGYRPVALGNTRLRTETAGMVAATILKHLTGFGKL